MRILVTGAAGFLGFHLCNRLVAEGHHVVGLDDFSTGSNRPEGVEIIEEDVRSDLEAVDAIDICFDGAIERIYHLACPASPAHYQADHVRTLETAVLGTLRVCELAWSERARVLIASTSEVYGDPTESPQAEAYRGNVNPYGERACYDEGKRAAEAAAYAHGKNGVDVRVARLFNTYGPGMAIDDGRLVPNIVTQVLAGKPFTVFGDGRQTRSFCYVDDTIEGLVRLMEHPSNPGPTNIGNPHEITVDELVAAVVKASGRAHPPVLRMDAAADDPARRCPDITKARELLGYEPRVGLEEGLRATLDDFRRRL